MGKYQLSSKAEDDLEDMYVHGLVNYTEQDAKRYLAELYQKFSLLADNPYLGAAYYFTKNETRRSEHKAHSIYYSINDSHILILRILHKRMDPAQHF